MFGSSPFRVEGVARRARTPTTGRTRDRERWSHVSRYVRAESKRIVTKTEEQPVSR